MTTRPRSAFHLPLLAFALAIFGGLTMFAPAPGRAQTITVLHSFTGGADGAYPAAGVTFDQQGRIYGTASGGGRYDGGVVYRLVRGGEGWVLSPIYAFGEQPDGNTPYARVVFGPDGLLYGTTNAGGTANFGTVFSLRPPATACTAALCPWLETILYRFTGGADGGNPYYGDLIFDQAGTIYGTTHGGGVSGGGVVFKLTRSGSGWTESVLWSFNRGSDGAQVQLPRFRALMSAAPEDRSSIRSSTLSNRFLSVLTTAAPNRCTPSSG
jgi:uncharacterized repeat protein (TIGR03803 family)